MKTALTILLAVSVIFVCVFPAVAELLVNPEYVVYLLDMWGQNSPPDLLGGNDYSGTFSEGAKATLYLVSYPVRFAVWIAEQFSIFVIWTSGDVVPLSEVSL